ncbi:outer membrane protein W precursor [mine drainage metagenome]|uniref:Outer membrane protein W n=1 Tax=mine drainage metagenome TaxID=410659 RepID=A0A1J5Q365_9ZZZZ
MTFFPFTRGPIARCAAALCGAALLAAAPAARAAEGGVNTVYIGVAYLQAHSSLPDLSGLNTPSGLNLNVGNAATLGLGFVHDFNGHWSGELALGYPPRVRTDAMGAAWQKVGIQPGTGVTDVHLQSPTVFLNYHPLGVHHRIDPYVGLGVNYTRFTDTTALSSLNNAIGPTQIHLSDSWGAAAHVGLQYHFDRRWSLVGSIAVADVQSDLTATTYLRGSSSVVVMQGKSHINFHPVVYTVAIGYSF